MAASRPAVKAAVAKAAEVARFRPIPPPQTAVGAS